MERMRVVPILVLALALRVWNLDQNGWGAEYYSAAVRSMSASWHNFLYASFDPAGFISVDKPPVALWLQVASVKLFGFQPWALLLPQALAGTACVAILYAMLRKRTGEPTALIAALLLAVTPVLVAVNRTNNMDSCLVLVLMLAAAVLLHAAETGRRSRWLLAMALVGVAFAVKMLAAFIVVPTFVLVYGLTAPLPLRRRIVDLLLGGMVLAFVSSAWLLLSALTPASERPWVGGSPSNSMLELTLGHNALSRFVDRGIARKAPAPTPRVADDPAEARPGLMAQRLFVRTPPGPTRLLDGHIAAQFAWLLPFAVMGLVLGARGGLRLFWLAWTATYVVVYSVAGGIVHFYYFATLAPAFAALAAIGFVALWTRFRERASFAWLLPATLAVTALWQLYVQCDALQWTASTFAGGLADWRVLLTVAAGTTMLFAAIALGISLARFAAHPRAALAALCAGGVATLALPLAWALSTVLVPAQGTLPSADLYRLDPVVLASDDPRVRPPFGKLPDVGRLADFLARNRAGERYALATTTTRFAAPVIIVSGLPVMAMGGFHGLDGAMTPQGLATEVESKRLRFVMLGDAAPTSRRLGAEAALQPVSDWVRAHGRRVDGAHWRWAGMPRGIALYDLRPADGLR